MMKLAKDQIVHDQIKHNLSDITDFNQRKVDEIAEFAEKNSQYSSQQERFSILLFIQCSPVEL